MREKRHLIGIGISLAVVMLLGIWGVETVSAAQCKMIQITDQRQATKTTVVDPETLYISKGDCVFWANMGKGSIRVKFKGSLQCAVNPVGFDCEESKKSFITGYFGRGESRSMEIVEAGTYQYEIQSKKEPSVKTTGTIIVK